MEDGKAMLDEGVENSHDGVAVAAVAFPHCAEARLAAYVPAEGERGSADGFMVWRGRGMQTISA